MNKDTDAKKLMIGNQTTTAVALGMVAQDVYPKFNEMMKRILNHPEAENFTVKNGFKKGIIRIWQKLAEYDLISPIK